MPLKANNTALCNALIDRFTAIRDGKAEEGMMFDMAVWHIRMTTHDLYENQAFKAQLLRLKNGKNGKLRDVSESECNTFQCLAGHTIDLNNALFGTQWIKSDSVGGAWVNEATKATTYTMTPSELAYDMLQIAVVNEAMPDDFLSDGEIESAFKTIYFIDTGWPPKYRAIQREQGDIDAVIQIITDLRDGTMSIDHLLKVIGVQYGINTTGTPITAANFVENYDIAQAITAYPAEWRVYSDITGDAPSPDLLVAMMDDIAAMSQEQDRLLEAATAVAEYWGVNVDEAQSLQDYSLPEPHTQAQELLVVRALLMLPVMPPYKYNLLCEAEDFPEEIIWDKFWSVFAGEDPLQIRGTIKEYNDSMDAMLNSVRKTPRPKLIPNFESDEQRYKFYVTWLWYADDLLPHRKDILRIARAMPDIVDWPKFWVEFASDQFKYRVGSINDDIHALINRVFLDEIVSAIPPSSLPEPEVPSTPDPVNLVFYQVPIEWKANPQQIVACLTRLLYKTLYIKYKEGKYEPTK